MLLSKRHNVSHSMFSISFLVRNYEKSFNVCNVFASLECWLLQVSSDFWLSFKFLFPPCICLRSRLASSDCCCKIIARSAVPRKKLKADLNSCWRFTWAIENNFFSEVRREVHIDMYKYLMRNQQWMTSILLCLFHPDWYIRLCLQLLGYGMHFNETVLELILLRLTSYWILLVYDLNNTRSYRRNAPTFSLVMFPCITSFSACSEFNINCPATLSLCFRW